MTALTTPTIPTEGSAAPQAPAAPTQGSLVTGQQAPATGQPAQNAPAEQQQVNNAGDKPAGAPERYEFKAHEGYEFDAGVLDAYTEVAKELNLTQDAAQKVLDKVAPRLQERQLEQVEAIRNEWAQSSRVDKEFGGEALNANLAVAKKALDAFGTPELRSLLNESGLGNHPELIRFMFRAGAAISEDRFVAGSQGGKGAVPKNFNDLANALYSNKG